MSEFKASASIGQVTIRLYARDEVENVGTNFVI